MMPDLIVYIKDLTGGYFREVPPSAQAMGSVYSGTVVIIDVERSRERVRGMEAVGPYRNSDLLIEYDGVTLAISQRDGGRMHRGIEDEIYFGYDPGDDTFTVFISR